MVFGKGFSICTKLLSNLAHTRKLHSLIISRTSISKALFLKFECKAFTFKLVSLESRLFEVLRATGRYKLIIPLTDNTFSLIADLLLRRPGPGLRLHSYFIPDWC